MKTKFKNIIRTIYLYTFSAVGLIIFIVGAIGLVNVALKTYVFPLEHYSEWYYDNCSELKYRYDLETYEEPTPAEEADCEEQRATADSDEKKRDLAIFVADIVVGTPIWLYHWTVIQRRKKYEE